MSKKLRIGLFSFSCSADNMIVFTDLMDKHYKEWRQLLDIKYAPILQSKNSLEPMDVAFMEGAIAAKDHEDLAKKVRRLATWVVAIGACACTGMPASQRNFFDQKTIDHISPILKKFKYFEKNKKLEEVIKVDHKVPGCPMDERIFLEVLDKALVNFKVK